MGAHIIIADDNPVVRHILSTIFAAAGHQVTAVESGGACLEKLRETAHSAGAPDVLFLDVQLLDMTGADVYRKIREFMSEGELPIAMLSANSREETLTTFPDLMPEFFLEKPFSSTNVRDVVKAALELKRTP